MKYYFRGLLIMEYDRKWKNLTVTEDFNKCQFIPEDYLLMADFMDRIYKLQTGIPVNEEDLKDIEVY